MSGLFSKPNVNIPAAPPAAPTATNSAPNLDEAARQAALGQQRGRSATMLTGGLGVNDTGNTSKVLLGGR